MELVVVLGAGAGGAVCWSGGLSTLDRGYGGRQSSGDYHYFLLEAGEVMQPRVIWICEMLGYRSVSFKIHITICNDQAGLIVGCRRLQVSL